MDCGAQDALCELTNWLSQNDLLAPWLVELVGRFGIHAHGIAGRIAELVRDYGQTIVGLFGVTFGFWRWWRYREHILHKRLEEYLRESDERLTRGTADLIELIQRPAPGQQFNDPLFIDSDLRVVLRERNWDKPAYALGVAASADTSLALAIDAINRRLATAQSMVMSLRQQLFSAYAIRGAVAASRTRSGTGQANLQALSYFQSALAVPGHESDLTLREMMAHQLRKLGFAAARRSYAQLIDLGRQGPDRKHAIATARGIRYLSELLLGEAPGHALRLMRGTTSAGYSGALELIASCEPLDFWERIEKAHMHYYTAVVARRLGFVVIEANQLSEASTECERVIAELSRRHSLRPRRYRTLRKLALQTRDRIEEARQRQVYDLNWLP